MWQGSYKIVFFTDVLNYLLISNFMNRPGMYGFSKNIVFYIYHKVCLKSIGAGNRGAGALFLVFLVPHGRRPNLGKTFFLENASFQDKKRSNSSEDLYFTFPTLALSVLPPLPCPIIVPAPQLKSNWTGSINVLFYLTGKFHNMSPSK